MVGHFVLTVIKIPIHMPKESPANELTNQILELLYASGAYAWRQNMGGIYDSKLGVYRTGSKKGVADILGVYKSVFIAVEVKIGKDRLSPEQEGFIANVI